jgi:hypothetical protein
MQTCRFVTRAGSFLFDCDVPIIEGRRPEFIEIADRLFRHYKGATTFDCAEYRQVEGAYVKMEREPVHG